MGLWRISSNCDGSADELSVDPASDDSRSIRLIGEILTRRQLLAFPTTNGTWYRIFTWPKEWVLWSVYNVTPDLALATLNSQIVRIGSPRVSALILISFTKASEDVQQLFMAAKDLGIDGNVLNDLLARSGSRSSPQPLQRSSPTVAPSPTVAAWIAKNVKRVSYVPSNSSQKFATYTPDAKYPRPEKQSLESATQVSRRSYREVKLNFRFSVSNLYVYDENSKRTSFWECFPDMTWTLGKAG